MAFQSRTFFEKIQYSKIFVHEILDFGPKTVPPLMKNSIFEKKFFVLNFFSFYDIPKPFGIPVLYQNCCGQKFSDF